MPTARDGGRIATDRPRWLPAVAGGIVLAVVLGLYVRHALSSFPSFDGAMNLNVARSLAEGHGYAFRYDGVFPFPAQTDAPFILPAALMFRLFGIGLVTAQAVSVGYLVLFTLLGMVLLRRLGMPPGSTAAAAAACLLTPGVATFGLDGYGEVPMLFWVLAALLAAGRMARADQDGAPSVAAAAAGLLLALAVLTKLVAALCAVQVGLICVGQTLARPRGQRVRCLLALVGGTLFPLLGWELFRLWVLGGLTGWREWWTLQLGQVARQSGGAGLDPGASVFKIALHLRILSRLLPLPLWVLVPWLVLPWTLAVARLRDRWRADPERRLLLLALLSCVVLYQAWWLAITPTDMTWLRRIVPALILQTCLLAATVADLPVRVAGSRRIAAGGAALAELAMLVAGLQASPASAPDVRRRDLRAAVAALRALPADAVVFGVGWWQAPALSLFSDRSFMNFERWSPARINALPHAFLVLDGAALDLGQDAIHEVSAVAELDPLLVRPEVALYRLGPVDPERPLQQPPLGDGGFDARTVPLAPGAGWYPSVGGWAWVRPISRIRLLHADQTRLVIEAAFWSELFAPDGTVRRLHVTVPGCLDDQVAVPDAGLHRLVLPLRCPPAVTPMPIELTMVLDARMPVPHQLDADTRDRAFEVSRLALER